MRREENKSPQTKGKGEGKHLLLLPGTRNGKRGGAFELFDLPTRGERRSEKGRGEGNSLPSTQAGKKRGSTKVSSFRR